MRLRPQDVAIEVDGADYPYFHCFMCEYETNRMELWHKHLNSLKHKLHFRWILFAYDHGLTRK